MHNTEFEKYPTSGEENVEVDVFGPSRTLNLTPIGRDRLESAPPLP